MEFRFRGCLVLIILYYDICTPSLFCFDYSCRILGLCCLTYLFGELFGLFVIVGSCLRFLLLVYLFHTWLDYVVKCLVTFTSW